MLVFGSIVYDVSYNFNLRVETIDIYFTGHVTALV